MSERYLMTRIMMICVMVSIPGCISQDTDGSHYVDTGAPIKIKVNDFFTTDEYFYAAASKVMCFDWEGNIIWETPTLGTIFFVFLEDAIFVGTFDISEDTFGVALISLEGEILWQKELGLMGPSSIGASDELLVAGSVEGKNNILWAFSKTGNVLWTYNHFARINQVLVSPDGSCVIFNDYVHSVNCVRDGDRIWSHDVGRVSTGYTNRVLAFAPDNSYLVYGSEKGYRRIVATTPDGDELWSRPLEGPLQSVIITEDSEYILAGSFGTVYKFTREGTLVWENSVGINMEYLAITPDADYIAAGSSGPPSTLIVLNRNGEVLWKARSFDTIFAVAISLDGSYVAFSNRLHQLFILPNPPEESTAQSIIYLTPHYSCSPY